MKWKFYLIKIVIAQLIVFPVFANDTMNPCLTNFKSHVINSDTIWFDDCNLNDKDLPVITSYLDNHPEITQLYLLNNNISDDGAILLSKNKTLKLLELRNNSIGKKGATALAHSSIHMIDLLGNNFDSSHLVALAKKSKRLDEVIILG